MEQRIVGGWAGAYTRAMGKESKPTRQWRVTLVRAKGQRVGTVWAVDAESAIRRAIELFHITDPHQQRRLIAAPIADE